MSSRLKGRVLNENGTIVKTRITIPWLIVIMFLFVTLTSFSAILMADEITVNGEVRPARFSNEVDDGSVCLHPSGMPDLCHWHSSGQKDRT